MSTKETPRLQDEGPRNALTGVDHSLATAYERVISALRQHGSKVVENGSRANAQCPAHDDNNPSLAVTDIGDRTLVWCHGGCETRDVVSAIGLEMADLYNERKADYHYTNGLVAHRYYKNGKKTFSQENAGPQTVLYHLDQLQTVEPQKSIIFLVEGEADVHAIEALGHIATTAPGGAQAFHKVDTTPLAGHYVDVVVDRDDAGTKWAEQVALKLEAVGADYRFFHAKEGKDASDHIAAGHALTDLTPHPTPPAIPYAVIPVSAPPSDNNTPDDEREGATKVILRQASTIQMRGVKWFHKGLIPAGMVTLLAGREGIGKSTVWADIAAKATRGTLPGRYLGKPQTVVVCATEDSWEHTIAPRLRAANADMDLVFHIIIEDEEGHERALSFPRDTHRIELAFRTTKPALFIVDPVLAVIDGKIDTHKQAEVQQALEPVVRMCARLNTAFLGLIHVNKSGTNDVLTSIMGSRAFATLPRSILFCMEDDTDFVFSHAKCNVGPKQPSIRYRLSPVRFDLPPEDVEDGDEPYIETSRVVWGDIDNRTANEILQDKIDRAGFGDARKDVLDVIEAADGAIDVKTIKAKLDHPSKAIENALTRLVKDGQAQRVARGVYQDVKLAPNP